MRKIIVIEADLPDDDDGERLTDVLTLLEHAIPYMADNVRITVRDGE